MAEHPPTLKKHSEGEAVLGAERPQQPRAARARRRDFRLRNRGRGPAVPARLGSRLRRDRGPADLGRPLRPRGPARRHLSEIAQHRLGDANRFHEIFDLNTALISDPDKIFPDQVLTLPHDAC